jgi:alpha-N-arabinofuranosidase
MIVNSFLLFGLALGSAAIELTVKSSGGNATSPYAYGIMWEDINNSGDGGVYAELVQNRAFQGSEVSFLPALEIKPGFDLTLPRSTQVT